MRYQRRTDSLRPLPDSHSDGQNAIGQLAPRRPACPFSGGCSGLGRRAKLVSWSLIAEGENPPLGFPPCLLPAPS